MLHVRVLNDSAINCDEWFCADSVTVSLLLCAGVRTWSEQCKRLLNFRTGHSVVSRRYSRSAVTLTGTPLVSESNTGECPVPR